MSMTQQQHPASLTAALPPERPIRSFTSCLTAREDAALRRYAQAHDISPSHALRVLACRALGLPVPPKPRIGRPPKTSRHNAWQEVMPV